MPVVPLSGPGEVSRKSGEARKPKAPAQRGVAVHTGGSATIRSQDLGDWLSKCNGEWIFNYVAVRLRLIPRQESITVTMIRGIHTEAVVQRDRDDVTVSSHGAPIVEWVAAPA